MTTPNIYSESSVRLMIVGQQTRGWGEGVPWGLSAVETVDGLIRWYENYELCKSNLSPFWKASHELCRRLNGDGRDRQFIWANLAKIDEAKGPSREDLKDLMAALFIVLPTEIRLPKPDVVVFFTGPCYDERLAATFPGCEFKAVKGRDKRALSLLKHPMLPPRSYRTYHPN